MKLLKKKTLNTLKQFDANVPQFSNHVIFQTSLRWFVRMFSFISLQGTRITLYIFQSTIISLYTILTLFSKS